MMKAWLITWEWMADSAAVADEVAAILNPRWSGARVAGIVEFLYAKCTATASELAAYAGRPARNPYRANQDFNCHITCGHHPWLHARLVDDLAVSRDPETGIETIAWTEPPLYSPREHGPELVRARIPGKFVRRITGALSDELIWDRERGELKAAWKAGTASLASDTRARN
jgi:hypothetical protein